MEESTIDWFTVHTGASGKIPCDINRSVKREFMRQDLRRPTVFSLPSSHRRRADSGERVPSTSGRSEVSPRPTVPWTCPSTLSSKRRTLKPHFDTYTPPARPQLSVDKTFGNPGRPIYTYVGPQARKRSPSLARPGMSFPSTSDQTHRRSPGVRRPYSRRSEDYSVLAVIRSRTHKPVLRKVANGPDKPSFLT